VSLTISSVVVDAVMKRKFGKGEALPTHHQVYSLKNVHSYCSYECIPNIVNVFGKAVTSPGPTEVNLAATTPWGATAMDGC
jgi:hypothetical protein